MGECIPTPEIISAKEAKAKGLRYYFTGKPCKRGHVSQRRVINLWCLECEKERDQASRKAHPEKSRERTKRWRSRNLEHCRAKSRNWNKTHPESVKAADQRMRRKKRGILGKSLNPKPLDMSPEKVAQREYHRNWSAMNRHRIRVFYNNRRALKAGNGGRHSIHDIAEILKSQKRRCAYCRVKLGSFFHVDHIIPLYRGGTNDRKNLQILCQPCNQSKSHKDPIDFAREKGLLL